MCSWRASCVACAHGLSKPAHAPPPIAQRSPRGGCASRGSGARLGAGMSQGAEATQRFNSETHHGRRGSDARLPSGLSPKQRLRRMAPLRAVSKIASQAACGVAPTPSSHQGCLQSSVASCLRCTARASVLNLRGQGSGRPLQHPSRLSRPSAAFTAACASTTCALLLTLPRRRRWGARVCLNSLCFAAHPPPQATVGRAWSRWRGHREHTRLAALWRKRRALGASLVRWSDARERIVRLRKCAQRVARLQSAAAPPRLLARRLFATWARRWRCWRALSSEWQLSLQRHWRRWRRHHAAVAEERIRLRAVIRFRNPFDPPLSPQLRKSAPPE